MLHLPCTSMSHVCVANQAALEAREAKLQDSWKAIRAQAAAVRKEKLKVHNASREPMHEVPHSKSWRIFGVPSNEATYVCFAQLLLAVQTVQGVSAQMSLLLQDANAASLDGSNITSMRFLDVVNHETVADAAEALENVRTALVERETALQRWAVALDLEVWLIALPVALL